MEKIIWAVDPYQNDLGSLRSEGELLGRWFGKHSKAAIEPVFVLTPAVWPLPSRYFDEALPQLKDEARKKLDHFYSWLDLSWFSRPTLLTHPSDHVENVVRTLLDHATKRRASLIVARTHARRGLSRAILGSVAETLLLRSPIPLLFLNPNHELSDFARGSRILFPTDLDKRSEKAFNQVLRIAKARGATIDLVHGIKKPRADFKRLLGIKKTAITDEISVRRKEAERLKALAAKAGVRLRSHLLRTDRSVDELILEQAKRLRPALIAMEAKSGEVRSVFAGSATRRVVRGAPCPVWAIHARPRRA